MTRGCSFLHSHTRIWGRLEIDIAVVIPANLHPHFWPRWYACVDRSSCWAPGNEYRTRLTLGWSAWLPAWDDYLCCEECVESRYMIECNCWYVYIWWWVYYIMADSYLMTSYDCVTTVLNSSWGLPCWYRSEHTSPVSILSSHCCCTYVYVWSDSEWDRETVQSHSIAVSAGDWDGSVAYQAWMTIGLVIRGKFR